MKFNRPTGAAGDVKELEYIAALLQTSDGDDDGSWMDASIDATDIQAFLMSRYGIKTSEEEVRDVIFSGLAGGDGEDDCIDIIEMVSILVIPLLVKVSRGSDMKTEEDFKTTEEYDNYIALQDERKKLSPPLTIIKDVLTNILGDSGASIADPPKLTKDFIRHIFAAFDELDLIADDKLVDDMLQLASGGNPDAVLDAESFTRALTNDVSLYNIDNETKLTSHFHDVFGSNNVEEQVEEEHTEAKGKDATSSAKPANTVFTFPEIDFMADSFNGWEHAVLVWLIVIVSYLLFVYADANRENVDVCDSENMGCKIGASIANWIQIMFQLIVLVGGAGIALNFGNTRRETATVFGPLIGMASIGLFVFFPRFHSFDGKVEYDNGEKEASYFNTDLSESEFEHLGNLVFAGGVILFVMQIKNLLALLLPQEMQANNKIVSRILSGSGQQDEFTMKQAAIFKMNRMICNAYSLHQESEETLKKKELVASLRDSEEGEEKSSSQQIALANFTKMSEETEEVGGFVWAYKGIITGTLQESEGIWLHSRLLAGNMAQFLFVFIVLGYSVYFLVDLIDSLYPEVDFSPCRSTFEYESCYFAYEGSDYYAGIAVCDGVLLDGGDEGACASEFTAPVTGPLQTTFCNTMNTFAAAAVTGSGCDSLWNQTDALFLSNGVNITTFTNCVTLLNAAAGPNAEISDVIIEECDEFVTGALEVAYEGLDEEFQDLYNFCTNSTLNYFGKYVDICQLELYDIRAANINTFESGYSGNDYCQSVLSFCVVVAADNQYGTEGYCIIGEGSFVEGGVIAPYQFEGEKCDEYEEIQNTLDYYNTNVMPEEVQALVPEKWMIILSGVIAVIVGFTVSFLTASVYIPSTVHTVLKFRSGVIPSLRSNAFLKYRRGLESVTMIIGAMFWGMIMTTILMITITAGVVFLLVWHVTRPVVIQILAIIIGIGVTTVLKILISMVVMKMTQAGLYRTRPLQSNIFSFCLECWNFGLTAGSVTARLAKFIIATALYVGRIDTPVLAEGLLMDIDKFPIMFRKDILAAEAHHHPYIELLGKMYMMKLRHGDDFGKQAGCIWRLLFTIALMPWLKKFRIKEELDLDNEDLLRRLNEMKKIKELTSP